MPTIKEIMPESLFTIHLSTGATGRAGKDGKDGYTPQKGKDYFDGKDGKDYVLTEADKKEIGANLNDEYGIRIANNETYLDKLTPKNTLKGQPLYITDALELDTFENKIYGNSYQETTSGKNLLNINGDLYSLKAYPTVIENNKVYVTTASNSGNTISSLLDYIPVEENESYIYTMKAVQGNVRYGFSLYDEDKKVIKNSAIVTGYTYLSAYESYYSDTLKTFTIPSGYGIKYIRPIIFAMSNTSTPNVYEELMIRRASVTDDTYEPFTNGASPNPDYPQEIEVVEGDLSFKVIGENLFNPQKAVTDSNNNNTYITEDGKWIRFVTGANSLTFYPEGIEKNTQYTFKTIIKNGSTNANDVSPRAYYTDGTSETLYYSNLITDTNERTFTGITSKDKTLSYIKYVYSYNQPAFMKIEGTSLKKGTDTEYTPYKEQIVPLDLKGNWVGKINDDIKDYLVTDKKMYWLVKNVGKVVLNGSVVSWNRSVNGTEYAYWTSVNQLNNFKLGYSPKISNYFPYKNVSWKDASNNCICENSSISLTLLMFRFNEATTIDEWKTWLSTHNVTVYYQLATPEIIELGGLPETIKTFEGVNNIQVLANLPTEIEVKYALDVKKYFDNKLAEISAQII